MKLRTNESARQNTSADDANLYNWLDEQPALEWPNAIDWAAKAGVTYSLWGIWDCVTNPITDSLIVNFGFPFVTAGVPALILLFMKPGKVLSRIALGMLIAIAGFNGLGLGLSTLFGSDDVTSFVLTMFYLGLFVRGFWATKNIQR